MARRENGRGGATCSYNFDSLLPAPCLPRAEKRDDAYEERETKAIALEKDGARAEEGKKERRKYPRKKRGKRSSWGGCELA